MTGERAYVVRAFDLEADVPAFVRLVGAIEATDQRGADTSEEGLRAQLAWPGHDPSRDRLLLEEVATGAIVGHSLVFSQSPKRAIVEVAVHAEWRRRGLGTRLLDAASELFRSGDPLGDAASTDALRARVLYDVGSPEALEQALRITLFDTRIHGTLLPLYRKAGAHKKAIRAARCRVALRGEKDDDEAVAERWLDLAEVFTGV